MDEKQIERLAAELGRKRAGEIDPEATAQGVLARLRAEPAEEASWQRPVWRRRMPVLQALAAAAIVAAVALGVRQLGGPQAQAAGEVPVQVSLEQLAEAELSAVLDSLESEAPVYELVPAGLDELSEAELSTLLESLEG
jgi:hypothetical protein